MMLLKGFTQYLSKFGKLSSGHRTGNGHCSLQSQRKAVPNNVQTIEQLHSFCVLVRLCPKSFKLGFSSMWTENFLMCKLGLEGAEEKKVKLNLYINNKITIGLWSACSMDVHISHCIFTTVGGQGLVYIFYGYSKLKLKI